MQQCVNKHFEGCTKCLPAGSRACALLEAGRAPAGPVALGDLLQDWDPQRLWHFGMSSCQRAMRKTKESCLSSEHLEAKAGRIPKDSYVLGASISKAVSKKI